MTASANGCGLADKGASQLERNHLSQNSAIIVLILPHMLQIWPAFLWARIALTCSFKILICSGFCSSGSRHQTSHALQMLRSLLCVRLPAKLLVELAIGHRLQSVKHNLIRIDSVFDCDVVLRGLLLCFPETLVEALLRNLAQHGQFVSLIHNGTLDRSLSSTRCS